MKIHFEKYQGTGNDFILVDDRKRSFPEDDLELIKFLCSRGFGVGSDGLMLIRDHADTDFEMVFFNPDGSKSLCGNGSRCAVVFARELGLAGEEGSFLTTDGIHKYRLTDGGVAIEMRDVKTWEKHSGHVFIDTGSPHLIVTTKNVDEVDVFAEGSKLRRHPAFIPINGTNVNFVSAIKGQADLKIRTYERGVENETLSCGTGVTAAALAAALEAGAKSPVSILTRGGLLTVRFTYNGATFADIWLEGPALAVFKGTIDA